MTKRFATLDDYTPQEQEGERTRMLKGEGTPFLRAPGLRALEAIRIGGMTLPLQETRCYPTDGRGGMEETEEPLVEVQQADSETPILVRSVLSNDGVWPQGTSIFVTGEWKD